jgi:triosephosphate isomerase
MKKYIIANWKSNKTPQEAKTWLKTLFAKWPKNFCNSFEVVICAPFIDIPIMYEVAKEGGSIKLGIQNVSPFSDGPYTGEVSARLVKEMTSYVIIGHSERRKYFSETDQIIADKTINTIKNGLIPIICISREKEITLFENYVKGKLTPEEKQRIVFAYEPLWAISSGSSDDPNNADKFIENIKNNHSTATYIYGGSVDGQNVYSFIHQPHIDGVLVGTASLVVDTFLEVIKHALPK